MRKQSRFEKTIQWAPRVLAIAYILFISLFALDAFSEPLSWMVIAGFLIHLIPNFLLVLILVFSWNRPLVGAVSFVFFGVVFTVFFDAYESLAAFAIVPLPLLITGGLFSWNYLLQWRE